VERISLQKDISLLGGIYIDISLDLAPGENIYYYFLKYGSKRQCARVSLGNPKEKIS
jgi:hypothetical protein